ncbi:myb-like protein X [Strongylocentrotus purpuratus]|uniref:Zinc finger CW-type PWWP domain protein 1-like n=1 Tax=Strongylocentrotus purpuratus TaxID=7668 RepID=A0A7M7NY93_STRPU|nr:myb-like protein X [Strongylocentrotus purpuratus]
MAENELLSGIEEFLSPVKHEPSDREYTPPPRQKKQKVKRRPTHKAICPKNPSRRLIFSSQDEEEPSPPRHCNKKKRKMKRRKSRGSKKQKFTGRDVEVSGTWVQCTDKECMKWRFLSDITDPSHVPDVWTCEMNSDTSHNSCLLPEQDYSTLDFVHAKFTEGSLVWAKMQGFPWWPAMIEEDPDSELCLYPDPVTGYVTDYHVVFLDKKVTRCWVKVSNIQKYEDAACPGSMTLKGHDYSQKIKAAKEIADGAQKLPIKERIKTFGFSARFKGPWGEEKERTSDEGQHAEPPRKMKGPKPKERVIVGPKPKKRVIVDEDSSLPGSLLSHSDMDDILDEAEALLGEVQNIVMEVEDEVQESLLQEMEIGEKESPSRKREADDGKDGEPPAKERKGTSKKMEDKSSSKHKTGGGERSEKPSKEKQTSEMKLSKQLERIQKKKEEEMRKLELLEFEVREKIERREKEKQAKKDQKAKGKQEREEKKQREKGEEQERKDREKQEEKEKSKQEKKELKQKEKEAKKELKKKEKAEKKALKGDAGDVTEDVEKEDDAEKAARKEKKRLEKEERKRVKKETKAKRKEEKKKEGNDGKVADQKEKGAGKVKPSFQKAKKPVFSAPKRIAVEPAPALPEQPTPAEESSVSKEIGALIKEIVNETDQGSIVAFESPVSTTDVPAVTSTDLQVTRTSPAKSIKKQFKPKFSIKTKDGHSLSEANLPDCTTTAPPAPASGGGLDALDEETSVDISKILEVNTKQDCSETSEADPAKENNSDPLAFPLSQMTGKQLELLPKPEHQEDAGEHQKDASEHQTDTREHQTDTSEHQRDASDKHLTNAEEAPGQDSQLSQGPKIDDTIAEDTKLLKTLDPPDILECSPDPADWSEPDEPQTVPGQKRVMVATAAAANGNDSEDSEPFDMEE